MTFNVQPSLGLGQLHPADEAGKQRAMAFLSGQSARGGTVLQPAIATAYKYASGDRPLNVIILSDGLTEQQERRILLEQIQARPGNTRVFCIGVGNDVNRPLLEQLAEDSGGLAAFLSSGDNFARQARAFRQKLTRPFAANLQIQFAGVEIMAGIVTAAKPTSPFAAALTGRSSSRLPASNSPRRMLPTRRSIAFGRGTGSMRCSKRRTAKATARR
jgi:hypothetical protein